ncbi:hypothetical protein EJ04DRAFT_446067 [Polyplosphaeria fusca]|uniref:Monopolin complex subunit Csm1/Pcs1 C-terminal domain-containing protein n=1 Tax=Polyplosphaeria fusca TaxID=682080 RepID=A0A9P4QRZ7_9PLEO|nr:hypothetical protein EJ04DRAFT_446067 [Polyplosphaeria fusca]
MQQHRSSSKLPPSAQRRAGSASDSERDSALRRKLGDATKMLEALIVKYDNLKEVASSQKESNFEQLRRRSERTAKDRDAVIKALKQQMSEAHSSLAELDSLKKTLAKMDKDNDKMEAENKLLAAELHSIRSENKTLFTKLTAARSSAPPEGKQVPGSAVKARSAVILPGSAEAAKEALLRQLKIDLYSDLTNLVVCGIKRGEGEDVFDCLQTGRNGTLHFHLSVAQDSETFEDAEFVYSPQLNESRDRELLDLLPDYLTEEIVFPRAQVAKFYMKVVDSMSKKIEIEDE